MTLAAKGLEPIDKIDYISAWRAETRAGTAKIGNSLHRAACFQAAADDAEHLLAEVLAWDPPAGSEMIEALYAEVALRWRRAHRVYVGLTMYPENGETLDAAA